MLLTWDGPEDGSCRILGSWVATAARSDTVNSIVMNGVHSCKGHHWSVTAKKKSTSQVNLLNLASTICVVHLPDLTWSKRLTYLKIWASSEASGCKKAFSEWGPGSWATCHVSLILLQCQDTLDRYPVYDLFCFISIARQLLTLSISWPSIADQMGLLQVSPFGFRLFSFAGCRRCVGLTLVSFSTTWKPSNVFDKWHVERNLNECNPILLQAAVVFWFDLCLLFLQKREFINWNSDWGQAMDDKTWPKPTLKKLIDDMIPSGLIDSFCVFDSEARLGTFATGSTNSRHTDYHLCQHDLCLDQWLESAVWSFFMQRQQLLWFQ